MAISFACPKCGKQIRAKEEHAGRKGRCKECGTLFVIPALVAVAVPNPSFELEEEFDSSPPSSSSVPPRLDALGSLRNLFSSLVASLGEIWENLQRNPRIVRATVAVKGYFWKYPIIAYPAAIAAALVVVVIFLGMISPPNPPIPQEFNEMAAWLSDSQPRTLYFKFDDFQEAHDWAKVTHLTLNRKQREGNEFAYDEYRNQVEQKLKSFIGANVVWSLPVERITREYVEVENFFIPYLCVACLPNNRTTSSSGDQLAAVSVGTGVLFLDHQVPRDEALSLRRGESITISGSIYRAGLQSGTHLVVIELNNVMSTKLTPEQRKAAAANSPPRLSSQEHTDQYFRRLTEMLAPR